MKESVTEVVFVLDRSGSMSGMESDTIGGFNGMLGKQKNQEGKAYITTVLFDNEYEVLHDHLDIDVVEKITEDDYFARGCTALLDAMGKTISKMKKICRHSKPDKVVFVVITDGYENASREYSSSAIRKMVKECENENWEFVFLGANIDAFATASDLGFRKNRTANYSNDSRGVSYNFEMMGEFVTAARCESPRSKAIFDECLERIEADYESR